MKCSQYLPQNLLPWENNHGESSRYFKSRLKHKLLEWLRQVDLKRESELWWNSILDSLKIMVYWLSHHVRSVDTGFPLCHRLRHLFVPRKTGTLFNSPPGKMTFSHPFFAYPPISVLYSLSISVFRNTTQNHLFRGQSWGFNSRF